MRVPAQPQPLIVLPMLRRAEASALTPVAAGAPTFSGPEVLRQALVSAPPSLVAPPALQAGLPVPVMSAAAQLDVLQSILRAPAEASGTDGLRQTAVIGLLRALAGKDGALPVSGLTTRAGPVRVSMPDQSAPDGATPAPTSARVAVGALRPGVIALASGDLLLRLQQPLQADGIARPPLQAEVLLHPTLIRHAPLLAAALAASDWLPDTELPTLHLSQAQVPQWLGFQLMVSPAALWPVMVCVASGHLHLPRVATDSVEAGDEHEVEEAEEASDEQTGEDAADDADDPQRKEKEEESPPFEIDERNALNDEGPLSFGERVAFWIAVQRLRLAFR